MIKLTIFVAIVVAPVIAVADDRDAPPSAYGYAWHDNRLASDIGVAVTLGGGVSGFTDQAMRDTVSNVGGAWNLRATFGSHTPLGLDVSYVGTASSLDALVGSQHGTLIGTTTEAALRFNVLPHHKIDPYGFAGIGWQRYDISGGTFTLSDSGVRETDDSIEVPLGVGVGLRDKSGFVLDAHGTLRIDNNANLVLDNATSTSFAPMHTWEVSAAAGYEF